MWIAISVEICQLQSVWMWTREWPHFLGDMWSDLCVVQMKTGVKEAVVLELLGVLELANSLDAKGKLALLPPVREGRFCFVDVFPLVSTELNDL